MNTHEFEQMLGSHPLTISENGVRLNVTYEMTHTIEGLVVDGVPISVSGWGRDLDVGFQRNPYDKCLYGIYQRHEPISDILERIPRLLRERHPTEMKTIQVIQAYDDNPENWMCLVDRFYFQKGFYYSKKRLPDGEYIVAQNGEIIPIQIQTTKKGSRSYRVVTRIDNGEKLPHNRCAFVYMGGKLVL